MDNEYQCRPGVKSCIGNAIYSALAGQASKQSLGGLSNIIIIGSDYFIVSKRTHFVKVARRRGDRIASGSAAAANIRRSKTRLLRMLVVVVALFAASWLPLYAVQLRMMFAPVGGFSDVEKNVLRMYVGPVAQWLGAANSCLNPFVYCYFNCGFRTGIAEQLGRAARLVRTLVTCGRWASAGGSGGAAALSVGMESTMTKDIGSRRRSSRRVSAARRAADAMADDNCGTVETRYSMLA